MVYFSINVFTDHFHGHRYTQARSKLSKCTVFFLDGQSVLSEPTMTPSSLDAYHSSKELIVHFHRRPRDILLQVGRVKLLEFRVW